MRSISSTIFHIALQTVLFIILLIITLIASIIKIAVAIYRWCFPLLFVVFSVYTFFLYRAGGLSHQTIFAAASVGLFTILYHILPHFLILMDKVLSFLGENASFSVSIKSPAKYTYQ